MACYDQMTLIQPYDKRNHDNYSVRCIISTKEHLPVPFLIEDNLTSRFRQIITRIVSTLALSN